MPDDRESIERTAAALYAEAVELGPSWDELLAAEREIWRQAARRDRREMLRAIGAAKPPRRRR